MTRQAPIDALVVDTSAIIALLESEPAAVAVAEALANARIRLMSVANALEATIVVRTRRGEAGVSHLDLLLERAGIEFVAVDRAQLALARDGHRRFGKGRHPAALNFGDCFAWALATDRAIPLLFVGEDFAHTDVTPVALRTGSSTPGLDG